MGEKVSKRARGPRKQIPVPGPLRTNFQRCFFARLSQLGINAGLALDIPLLYTSLSMHSVSNRAVI